MLHIYQVSTQRFVKYKITMCYFVVHYFKIANTVQQPQKLKRSIPLLKKCNQLHTITLQAS